MYKYQYKNINDKSGGEITISESGQVSVIAENKTHQTFLVNYLSKITENGFTMSGRVVLRDPVRPGHPDFSKFVVQDLAAMGYEVKPEK